MFGNRAKAVRGVFWFNLHMYRIDSATGETVFALTAGTSVREVVLEGFSETERLRVPMQLGPTGWVARIVVRPGWFFYRFCVDGRTRSDRGSGKVRSADGGSWSLALINKCRLNRLSSTMVSAARFAKGGGWNRAQL